MLRMILIALASFAGASSAMAAPAPVVAPTASTVDLTTYAKKTDVPTPSVSTPPCVADAGTVGSGSMVYALANHTHCSKVRKNHETTLADGTRQVTFPTAFPAGVVPICLAQAVPTAGTTDVINVQTDGDPTNTQVTFRITKTNRSVVSLIGLTVLSVQASPGATKFDYACFEP